MTPIPEDMNRMRAGREALDPPDDVIFPAYGELLDVYLGKYRKKHANSGHGRSHAHVKVASSATRRGPRAMASRLSRGRHNDPSRPMYKDMIQASDIISKGIAL